ncbi:unnamed protein product, partial [Pylaiella littoralis]
MLWHSGRFSTHRRYSLPRTQDRDQASDILHNLGFILLKRPLSLSVHTPRLSLCTAVSSAGLGRGEKTCRFNFRARNRATAAKYFELLVPRVYRLRRRRLSVPGI